MNMTSHTTAAVEPLSLRNAPSLIEKAWPTAKISAETQKERKANLGQTLTALGSYWKGRKMLVLNRACILAALLPATDDLERDIEIFEKLMGMADETFGRRFVDGPSDFAKLFPNHAENVATGKVYAWRAGIIHDLELQQRAGQLLSHVHDTMPGSVRQDLAHIAKGEKPVGEPKDFLEAFPNDGTTFVEIKHRRWVWRDDLSEQERERRITRAFMTLPYAARLEKVKRPEEILEADLLAGVWDDVNTHLGTDASSISELVGQLGVMRFGRRPKVADTFSGSGQIPFEAARIGCEAYASDLNPVACMLSWGNFNIVGTDQASQDEMTAEQEQLVQEIDEEIRALKIEHDDDGNRAKVFLYCLETRCPRTGYMVPVAPSFVISRRRN